MQNNNSDIFESTKKDIFNYQENKNENFFLDSYAGQPIRFNTKPEISRRLNDYDSNLLEEDAYKDVADETFKLEYKISKIEEELKYVNSQINAAKDISD